MGTLKTTLKVESTDLFPTPVSFTNVNNNQVNGNFSGFNTIAPGTAGANINVAAIDASAYVYAQAPTTNTDIVQILDGAGAQVCTLVPGDTVFFHYLGDTGTGLTDLTAIALNLTDKINSFVGERS